MSDKQGSVISLAIELIFIATVFVAALGLIWSVQTSTTITGETFATVSYPDAITLAHSDLMSGTVNVYNASWNPIVENGNYSIDLATGILTTTNPSKMQNLTTFSIDYHYNEWDSILTLIIKSILSLIACIGVILLVLTKVGYKVKI